MARRAAPAAGLLSPRAGVTDERVRGHAIPNPPSVVHRPHIRVRVLTCLPSLAIIGVHFFVGP